MSAQTFLCYKIITLSILYIVPNLQSQSYYEFIYLFIVSIISFFILKMSKRMFGIRINFSPKIINYKKCFSLFIVPFILYGIDFIGILADIFSQSVYLIIVSFSSALGVGLFEEIRD